MVAEVFIFNQTWLEAILATFVIGCAPILLIACVPLGKPGFQGLLNASLSFAVGGLLGDVFLHLIPHAFEHHSTAGAHELQQHHHHDDEADLHGDHGGHDHSHEHGHQHDLSLGLWVLAGLLTFFIIEKFVRSQSSGSGHSHGGYSTNGHTTAPQKSLQQSPGAESSDDASPTLRKRRNKSKKRLSNGTSTSSSNGSGVTSSLPSSVAATSHSPVSSSIKISGYLNLAADFSHNFTDGLAIGASFLAGRNVGYVTSLAVLFHEVPHEIGDFAILIESGFTRKQAVYAQFMTAIGALVGTVFSLVCGGMSPEFSNWILPFTAGGFIYIATVTVIPELLKGTSLRQSIIEIMSMMLGVFMMVLVSWLEAAYL